MKHSETKPSISMEDIVFENRNKAYGAYQLRKDTDKFLKVGLLIGLMFVTIFSAFSLTNKNNRNEVFIPDEEWTDTIIFQNVELPEIPPIVQEVAAPAPLTAQQMLAEFRPVEDTDPNAVDNTPDVTDLLPDVSIGLSNIDGQDGDPQIDKQPDIGTGITGIDEDNKIRDFVSVMPEFIGGQQAMMNFLSGEIEYPRFARENGIEGKVYVKFVIEKDGSVSNVTLIRGIGGGCDEEAMRAVRAMSDWLPGRQNNNPVRVYQTIPVIFVLKGN